MNRRFARSVIVFLFVVPLLSLRSSGQQLSPLPRIAYHLAMPVPATHLFEVKIDVEIFREGGPDQTLMWVDFQMPRWQPGRYSIGNFAANVQQFTARSGAAPLQVEKTDDQTWRVRTGGNRTITVTYKVFGDDLSGTFAELDSSHANYNGGEIFMYVVGHKQDAVELKIDPPSNWNVINGSTDRPGQTEWRFPNYEILIDNPTEIGPNWTLDGFDYSGKHYNVVVHSRGNEAGRRPRLVRDIERIVQAQVNMWGPPDFDRYTFIIHFAADDRSGDAMEHLTSTQIIRHDTLADPGSAESVLESASHELFHAWNVKRLRPVELGPWDWTRPANTKSLWIAEGLTNYYGHLMMRRAGLWDEGRLLEELGFVLSDVESAPGNRLMSAVDASLAAPFIDAVTHRQRTNLNNTSINYYFKGEAIGLVLDLMIRGRSGGRSSLDDVLTRMYDEFYVKSPNATYYLKGRGYTEDDFVRVLSEVTGTDMRDFYMKYIAGVEPLPYDDALAQAGLRLVKTRDREGDGAGITIDRNDYGSLRLGTIRAGSAAERAGLQQGDVLLAIGGVNVSHNDWRSVLNQHKPGERTPVRVERFRRQVTLTLEIGESEVFDYRLENASTVSAGARAIRAAWMSGARN